MSMSIATEPRLVQKLEGAPWEIEGYLKVGGYEAWKRCVDGLKAEDVVAELKKPGFVAGAAPDSRPESNGTRC
jgi:NADH-quinone oxidoreductase subunit F